MATPSFSLFKENTEFKVFEQPSPMTSLSATFEELFQDVHSSPEDQMQSGGLLDVSKPDLNDESSKDSGVDLHENFEISPMNSPISTQHGPLFQDSPITTQRASLPTSFRGLFTNKIKSPQVGLRRTLFDGDSEDDHVTFTLPTIVESPVTMLGHNAIRKHKKSSRRLQASFHATAEQVSTSPVVLMGHNASRKHNKSARRQGLKRKSISDLFHTSCDKKAKKDANTAQEDMKEALDKQLSTTEELVGDGSHGYRLPTVKGKQQGLKYISPATMVDVLTGRINLGENTDYKVIDCRYPFEFAGGHIDGAVNFHTQQQLTEFLDTSHKGSHNKDTILIFHCEFSSERGPKRARFFRDLDRRVNGEMYPRLNYPEIYIMLDGYKAFYDQHSQHCTPQGYTPMLHDSHRSDMKKFRSKSKSWSAGDQSLVKKNRLTLPKMRLEY